MPFDYNKANGPNSKELRKNMTPEEKKLWYDFLKKLPFTINRQKMIGPYILDFYCHSARLAIELDGAQHYEPDGKAKDQVRDKFLVDNNIKVLRYTNIQIHENFEGICYDIKKNIEKRANAFKNS